MYKHEEQNPGVHLARGIIEMDWKQVSRDPIIANQNLKEACTHAGRCLSLAPCARRRRLAGLGSCMW